MPSAASNSGPTSPPVSGLSTSPGNSPSVEDSARWFAEEVQPHEPALRAFLRRRFPSLHDVDDVVQDSYIKLLKAKPSGKIASVKAYLFTIARNTAFNVFRKQKIYVDVPVGELPEWQVIEEGPDAAAATHAREQDALMAAAIAQLPDRCREIFILRVARNCSHAEIAAQLGITEGCVRVQVIRAVKKLAEKLRGQREPLEP